MAIDEHCSPLSYVIQIDGTQQQRLNEGSYLRYAAQGLSQPVEEEDATMHVNFDHGGGHYGGGLTLRVQLKSTTVYRQRVPTHNVVPGPGTDP